MSRMATEHPTKIRGCVLVPRTQLPKLVLQSSFSSPTFELLISHSYFNNIRDCSTAGKLRNSELFYLLGSGHNSGSWRTILKGRRIGVCGDTHAKIYFQFYLSFHFILRFIRVIKLASCLITGVVSINLQHSLTNRTNRHLWLKSLSLFITKETQRRLETNF